MGKAENVQANFLFKCVLFFGYVAANTQRYGSILLSLAAFHMNVTQMRNKTEKKR